MNSPFLDWSKQRVLEHFPTRPEMMAELDKFLAGDMWQDSLAWIGELPVDPESLAAMARAIISENVLDELLTRWVGALVGKEPRWQLVPKTGPRPSAPKEGEQPSADYATIKGIEDALTAWWDERNMIGILQQCAYRKGAEGRCGLYLTIPAGLREADGTIPKCATLEEALEYIYVDVAAPSEAGIYTDKGTRLGIGIVKTKVDVAGQDKEQVEVTFYDPPSKLTVLKIFRPDGEVDTFTVNLNRRLFLQDTTCDALITPQLMQLQKGITLALTQLLRNINLAGDRQVDYINADPPGHWEDADANDPEAKPFEGADGQTLYRVFVPEPIEQGPTVRNFIDGTDVINKDGEIIGKTTPLVNVLDPVDVAHFTSTYATLRLSAHVQAKQAHVMLDTNAAISGVSREQARADFGTSLGSGEVALNHDGRWIIESVLWFAASLMQQPTLFEGYRCEFGCVKNLGPLTPEEQDQIRNNLDKKLISRERAMSMLGIDDVGAEQAKIDEEQGRQVAIDNQRTDATVIRAGLLQQNRQAAQIAQAATGGVTNDTGA